MTTTIPIAQLVEDPELYPRHRLDAGNVASLENALRHGGQVPPVVVEQGTMRLVDGWHRKRAWTAVYGPESAIPAELRSYPTQADLFLDAVRLNAGHGAQFAPVDHARIAVMATALGLDTATVAVALHISEGAVECLNVRVAIVPPEAQSAAAPGTDRMPLKRSVSHLQGQTLTAEQARAHAGQGGISHVLQARQITSALQHNLVDRNNARVIEALRELKAALDAWLEGG